MNQRTLGLAWAAVGLLVLAGLAWELTWWRSLSARAVQAAGERNRLTAEIRQKEEDIIGEMRAHAGLLQELQWSAVGADPGVFLNRLAELAQGSRLRVMSIGPLEKQSTAQYSKSWHAVQVTGPYRDIRELALRVEREKGVLEDLVVQARESGQPGPADGLSARFRMTALELSPEGRKIVDRAVAAAGREDAGRAPSLALPLPARNDGLPDVRDPFLFGPSVALPPAPPPAPATAAAPSEVETGTPGSGRPDAGAETTETPMELRGIVGFPGGFLAILNNQIVKAGDSVAGHRVERIAEREVVLRRPEGSTRVVLLPAIGAAAGAGGSAPGTAPAAPRR